MINFSKPNLVFPKLFCLQTPFGFQNITTDPHILADVHVECPDDRQTKLKIFVSELILDYMMARVVESKHN
jgi:hypothetical protein